VARKKAGAARWHRRSLLLNKYLALTTLDAQFYLGEMSVRLVLISIAVLVLAAACSGTGGSTPGTESPAKVDVDPAAATPEYVASLPRDQAAAVIDSVTDRYFDVAIGRCPDRANPCLNEQFETAFDQSGELAPLCKVNGTGFEYQFCLMIAAETVPMVTAAEGNPATDIDWSDVDSTNNAARKQFAEFIVTKKCSSSDRACIVEQAATLLGLSPTVGKSCQVHDR
jgi:hypothetical protein